MLIHAGTDARHFILPPPARGIAWRLFLNTAADSPDDIYPSLDGPPLPDNGVVTMEARSMVVYVARDVRPRAADSEPIDLSSEKQEQPGANSPRKGSGNAKTHVTALFTALDNVWIIAHIEGQPLDW